MLGRLAQITVVVCQLSLGTSSCHCLKMKEKKNELNMLNLESEDVKRVVVRNLKLAWSFVVCELEVHILIRLMAKEERPVKCNRKC